jgi:hypothetical protein
MYLIAASLPNGRQLVLATTATARAALDALMAAEGKYADLLVTSSDGSAVELSELTQRAGSEVESGADDVVPSVGDASGGDISVH